MALVRLLRAPHVIVPLALAFVFFFLPAAPALAQSQAIDGTIEGLVTVGGQPVAGAKIQAVNTRTGYERTGTTDESGRYSLQLLPPGDYVVLAEQAGYATISRANLELRAGTVLTIEFELTSTTFNESLEVTGASPTVEVARTVVSNTYDERTVRAVPTVGRSIQDFFTLAPGVNSKPLATSGSGTGTAITTYSGLGMRQMNVDGVSNNLQGAARNLVISQEAIEEFNTVTNFSAEFGRVAGGLQNVVTRSGTNQLHGSGYFFTRQKQLSSRPFLLAPTAPTPDFSRYNFGGTVGGRLRKDKAFFFVSYERWMQDNPSVVAISSENAALLGIKPENVGAFTSTFRAHTITARGDVQLSQKHRFSGRFNYYYDRESPLLNAAQQTRDVAQRFDENPYSYTVQLVSLLAPNIVNEARFLYAVRGISRGLEADPLSPQITVSGIGSFNGNQNGATVTRESGYHIVENVSVTMGKHTVKAGMDLLPVKFKERTTNVNGLFTFGGLAAVAGVRGAVSALDQFLFTERRTIDPATGLPYSYSRFTQAVGAEFFTAKTFNQGYFVQDDIRLSPGVKLNVGLRYELFTRPKGTPNPDLPNSGVFPTDRNNVAPRIGLAWDPFRDGRTVVRGGYGIYYNVLVAQTFNNLLRSNGRDVVNISVTPTTPGAPAFSRSQIPPVSAGRLVSDALVMSPDFEDIQVQSWFSTVERELADRYALSVTYQGSRATNLPVSLLTNITQNGTLADGRRRWTTANRPSPAFGNIFVASSIGFQQYHGLVTTLTKRFSHGNSFQASYNLSKSEGESFGLDYPNFGIFTSPSDPLDLGVDHGPGDYDMRHRFTLTGVLEPHFPLSGAADALLNGWSTSTRLIASSGYALNARTGQDDNADSIFNDRPSGIGYNAYHLPAYISFDLRLSRNFAFGNGRKVEVIAEGFNLTNRLNPTAVNAVYGPNSTPNATFQAVTQAETARQFQLAARFSF